MSCCRLSNCNLNGFSNGGTNNTSSILPTDVLSDNNIIPTSQNNNRFNNCGCNNNCVNENLHFVIALVENVIVNLKLVMDWKVNVAFWKE